jgi:hypothetical protein
MIETVLQTHFSRYPAMQIQDLYKLIHQASMGSEHAVPDSETARTWLTRELADMGAGIPEPLIDPISADGDIVRIHLRPYLAAGHEPDLLLEAFIRTANEYIGEARRLEGYWQAAVNAARFPAEMMDEYIQSMKARSYPAVHHSPEYGRSYRPAYRVVVLAFCPQNWK